MAFEVKKEKKPQQISQVKIESQGQREAGKPLKKIKAGNRTVKLSRRLREGKRGEAK